MENGERGMDDELHEKWSAYGTTVGEMCRWVCGTKKGMGIASMRCDSWCMMTRVMVSLRWV